MKSIPPTSNTGWRALLRGTLVVALITLLTPPSTVVRITSAGPAGTIHYPDLRTMPPSEIGIQYNPSTGTKLLRFSNTIANYGEGPLTLVPTNVNTNNRTTDAYQLLYSHDQNNNWYVVSSNYVGTFTYDPADQGWDFADFATYEIHAVAPDGSVDPTVLASMPKMACCISDDVLVTSQLDHVGTQTYTSCTGGSPQGISQGWADIYGWTLEGQVIDISGLPDGTYWLVSIADPDHLLNEGGGTAASNNTTSIKVTIASDLIWVDDAVPGGAATGAYGGDVWNWVSSNPAPFAGRLAHQSANKPGAHQHFFYGATNTMVVCTGNVLVAYVYLDPANMPGEIMLQWSDGVNWEHRAYWGSNLINNGTDGTASRLHMGPLPTAGHWVRLEVPASSVALEGLAISGMSFALYNGRATWDAVGVHVAPANSGPPPVDTTPPTVVITAPANNATISSAVTVSANASDNVGVVGVQFRLDGASLGAEVTASPYTTAWDTTSAANGSHTLTAVARDAAGNQATSSPVTVTVSNSSTGGTVWVEDAIPAGAWEAASGGDSWNWVSANPPPFSGGLAHQSVLAPGVHFHFFSEASATLALGATDTIVQYVYLDPANPPREIMIECFDGSSWSHRAYWGENLIPWGTDGTADQMPIGPLPPAGQWVKLSVPVSYLNLGGRSLSGMDFVLYDGSATWDHTGK